LIPWQPAPDEYNGFELTDKESGVTVEAGGEGLAETDISISDDNYRVGPAVRLTNWTAFDSAEVTIPLTEDVTQAEAQNLSVYQWETTDSAGWQPVETEIDLDAGTAPTMGSSSCFISAIVIPSGASSIA
jgi:hypothetical protein